MVEHRRAFSEYEGRHSHRKGEGVGCTHAMDSMWGECLPRNSPDEVDGCKLTSGRTSGGLVRNTDRDLPDSSAGVTLAIPEGELSAPRPCHT